MSILLSFDNETWINFALLIIDDGYTVGDIFQTFNLDTNKISYEDFVTSLLDKIDEIGDTELIESLHSNLDIES